MLQPPFYLPSKVGMFWVISFHPRHQLFSRLINHSTASYLFLLERPWDEKRLVDYESLQTIANIANPCTKQTLGEPRTARQRYVNARYLLLVMFPNAQKHNSIIPTPPPFFFFLICRKALNRWNKRMRKWGWRWWNRKTRKCWLTFSGALKFRIL